MLKNLLITTTAAAALATAAQAADLPSRAPPPYVPVPVFTWTGFYIGGNVGYATTDQRSAVFTGRSAAEIAAVGVTRPGLVSTDTDGFTGGGGVGYNYQFGSVVIGLEADAAYTDLSSRRTYFIANGAGVLRPNFVRHDLDYIGTVRGRIGYAWDRILVYGTGGFAYGDVTSGANFFGTAAAGTPLLYSGFRSRTETGWTAGGGVEYALPTSFSLFGSNAVTFKAEALYYDLGRRTVFLAPTAAAGAGAIGYGLNVETSGILARAGVNFKFGTF